MAALAAMATAAVLDATANDDEDYSFALEYDGPLPSYVIPHAVPIEIDQIPVATTAALAHGLDGDGDDDDDGAVLDLPVVQPLPSPPPSVAHRCLHPVEVEVEEEEEEEMEDKDKDLAVVVSPTSVIAFDRGGSEAVSGEITSSCGAASAGGGHGSPSCDDGREEESGELLMCSSSETAGAFSGEFKEEEDADDGVRNDDDDEEEEEDHRHQQQQDDEDAGIIIPGFEGDYDEYAEPAAPGSRSRALTDSAASSEFGFRSSAASGDLLDPSSSTAAAASTSNATKRVVTAVKFDDGWPASGSGSASASGSTSPSIHSGKPHAARGEASTSSGSRARKGACYRCGKGNRFTDKETCIVCGARYGACCVLRAMGSMPEGRKCVGCIGSAVDEDKRERLGKSSRMLRKLLNAETLQNIMDQEKSCEANQISPSHVVVNGKQLTRDEMIRLKTCPNPPSKIKPGNYWYDKVSGYWGQEGREPCKIISANLCIGGPLDENASNGNTGIFINGRIITGKEHSMLKYAGVQCAGSPHFWVNSDGTYQEEGMKTIKGNLWSKKRTRIICSILSLPFPSKVTNSNAEEKEVTSGSAPDYLDASFLQKLILVGCHGSGTGTIFKQAKFLYTPDSFSDEERESIKVMIQSSIYHYLGVLLEGRERFEEECLAEKRSIVVEEDAECAGTGNTSNEFVENTAYTISPRLKAFSDWFLKVMASGDLEAIFLAATREYAPVVEELWKDPAIQATYCRRTELPALPSVANYFLERVVDISRSDYEPSNMDILYATGITPSNGLAYTEFFFPHTEYYCSKSDESSQHEIAFRYQLIKVPTKSLTESCKWLEMFEDARMVIFCAALTDYDEYFEDQNGVLTNKMLASKKLFESITTHPTFEQTGFLLILSKFDLLEQKIEQSPLTKCDWFSDFNPVRSTHRQSKSSNGGRDTTPAQQAFHYVAVKFKRLFASLTGKKLYVVQANCLEQKSVDIALRYAKEIQKWEDERIGWCDDAGEFSQYSIEPSSLSD